MRNVLGSALLSVSRGDRFVNVLLEKLAGLAARRHWIFIIAWVVILGGLLGAKHAFGGEYVNNYTISGSDSATGLNVLNSTFPQQGGYGGQIVFHANERHGRGAAVGGQPVGHQRVQAAGRHQGGQPVRLVQFRAGLQGRHDRVRQRRLEREPGLAGHRYLDQLNNAVAPATKAGLQVEYGAGAGEIGQQTSDLTSEVIGLACALVLLLIMFGSLIAAGDPAAVGDLQRAVRARAARAARAVITFPTTAPTIATLLGLGVAVDYGLFLVARHREQLDSGMEVVASIRRAAGTSGAAIVVAGSTVAVSILGLYISGSRLRRVARPGRGDRRGGHDDVRADPGARVHGAGRADVRALTGPGPRPQGRADRAASRRRRPPPPRTSSTSTARSPGGGGWSATGPGRGRC